MVNIHLIAKTIDNPNSEVSVPGLSWVHLEDSGLSQPECGVLDREFNFVRLALRPDFHTERTVWYRYLGEVWREDKN